MPVPCCGFNFLYEFFIRFEGLSVRLFRLCVSARAGQQNPEPVVTTPEFVTVLADVGELGCQSRKQVQCLATLFFSFLRLAFFPKGVSQTVVAVSQLVSVF